MKKKEAMQLCKTIQKYSNGPRPPTVDFLTKVTKKPRSTVARWRKRLIDNKIIDAHTTRGVDVLPYLYDKSTFQELELIKQFTEQCEIEKKNPSRYVNPLYNICKVLNVHPESLVESEKTAESMFSKFENKWSDIKPGMTTERYAKALRKFAKYNKLDLKDSVAIPGSSQSKGDYATVHLTDDEFTKGLSFFEDNADFEFLACFALFHEIFPRPDMLFSWNPVIETQYLDVDDDSYSYGSCRVYENKQGKYYDKLILDPRVKRITEELDPNKPMIPKEHRDDMEHELSKALRVFYTEIGKIREGEVYEKGTPGWLYTNRPIYSLRHSAATMWVRRLNFNVNLVATMGWEDPKTLTTFYARTTTANIMQSGVCYLCKPPNRTTDKAVFCGAPHALAFMVKAFGDMQ